MTSRRSVALLLAVPVLSSAGCERVSGLFSTKQKGVPVSTVAPTLPAPPKPSAPRTGTPEERAVYYADLVAAPATRLAGWLALYDALGVPVVGQDGQPLGSTADDPIGPRFWQIWYASGLDKKGRGLPLTDAARLIGVATPQLDGRVAGAALLDDLRQAVKSSDPQVRLMGLFVRERIKRWPSHLDIQDARTTADKAIVDLPTLQMILWLTGRGALIRAAAASRKTTGAIEPAAEPTTVYASFSQPRAPAGPAPAPAPNKGPSSWGNQKPCSEKLGDADSTYWTNWLTNKALAGGVQLPGMTDAFKGLIEKAQIVSMASQKTIEKTAAVINKMNMAAALISLLLQISAMEINPKQIPAPLVRTKTTSRGKDGTIELQLYSAPEKLPDGNQMAACLGSFLSNAFGVSLSFPAKGPITGAEMTVQGGEGFPTLVLFDVEGTNSMRRWTDSSGVAEYKITGAPQKRDVPKTAKEVKKEFSVHVQAQPEEVNANTILNIFFGGLTFGTAPSASGGLGSAVDIAKAFKYDLGEYYFDIIDWGAKGYRASGSDGPVVYSGTICSLEQPFAVTGTHPLFVLPFKFVPSSATAGTMSYTANGSGVASAGGGPYTVEGADTDTPRIVVKSQSTASNRVTTTAGGGAATITLSPLETDECK
jgi:hypothetical protein